MKLYDITVPIYSELPVYPGDPQVSVSTILSIADGGLSNVSHIAFGVHTGTHVDAPNHFIDGALRVHDLELAKLIGPCIVVEIPEHVIAIEPEHIGDISGVDRLLLKTRNSAFWNTPEEGFRADFAYITLATAEVLVKNGLKLVGIDYLSIEALGPDDHPVHNILLEHEVIILEGLDLRGILPGGYDLACLPLKYIGGTGDGSPARTVLIER